MPLPLFLPQVEDGRWQLGAAASFKQSKNSSSLPVEVPPTTISGRKRRGQCLSCWRSFQPILGNAQSSLLQPDLKFWGDSSVWPQFSPAVRKRI